MKKEFKVLGLIVFLSLVCVGCGLINADTTRDIRHAGFALSGAEFECKDLLPSNDGYKKIKWLTGNYAITTDGAIYLLSLSQKYSNDQNCMVSPFTKGVVSMFDGKIIKGADKKLYYLEASGESAAFSAVPTSDSNYSIYNLILGDENVIKVITVDQDKGTYYVLKNDGNVYNYVVSKSGNSVKVISTSIVYRKSEYGSDIIDFNYAGKTSSTFVRTDTQMFRMIAQNKEECTKYADIACNYEMELDSGLSKHNDKILGYSGSLLITTYGKEFNVTA